MDADRRNAEAGWVVGRDDVGGAVLHWAADVYGLGDSERDGGGAGYATAGGGGDTCDPDDPAATASRLLDRLGGPPLTLDEPPPDAGYDPYNHTS